MMTSGGRRRACTAMSALALASGSACGHRSYKGDGHFTDRGWLSGTERYVLDLGSIDLATVGSRSYTLTNLPAERFALGFEVEPVNPEADAPVAPLVQVALTSPGVSVITHRAPLNQWIVSTSLANPTRAIFIYCGGPNEAGWAEAPDTAWGCIFKPNDSATYTLTVAVLEADTRARAHSVRVMIKGGPPDFLP